MSTDLTGEQMQAKITAARREAEGLKDRIKRKKDDLADTSCKLIQIAFYSLSLSPCSFRLLSKEPNSATSRAQQYRSLATNRDEASKKSQRPSSKDLCHALVN